MKRAYKTPMAEIIGLQANAVMALSNVNISSSSDETLGAGASWSNRKGSIWEDRLNNSAWGNAEE